MDGQSVKTTEKGAFEVLTPISGSEEENDIFWSIRSAFPIAGRVEAANMSDRRAAACLLGGLGPIFPTIKTVIADAGHQSRKLTRLIKAEGYELRIVKRRKRAFEVVGLTWIVERTFAWIGRYRRMSKDYEHRVQTSETLIDLIAIRLMLNRLTKS